MSIIPDLEIDCYVGSNFVPAFETMHDSGENRLIVGKSGKSIGLELACVSTTDPKDPTQIRITSIDTMKASSAGLADIKLAEHQHLQALLNGALPPADRPLGCTNWTEHAETISDFSKNLYPLPNMDQILRKLQAASYISALDLSSAYHQIPLKDESREITAFSIPGLGLFQFKRIPYALSNAGATFQRMIDRVIGPELEPYAYSYLDDIIIVTENFEDHLAMLERVLVRIKGVGLTINREKSVFRAYAISRA